MELIQGIIFLAGIVSLTLLALLGFTALLVSIEVAKEYRREKSKSKKSGHLNETTRSTREH